MGEPGQRPICRPARGSLAAAPVRLASPGEPAGSPSRSASGDVRLDIQSHGTAQVSGGEGCQDRPLVRRGDSRQEKPEPGPAERGSVSQIPTGCLALPSARRKTLGAAGQQEGRRLRPQLRAGPPTWAVPGATGGCCVHPWLELHKCERLQSSFLLVEGLGSCLGFGEQKVSLVPPQRSRWSQSPDRTPPRLPVGPGAMGRPSYR